MVMNLNIYMFRINLIFNLEIVKNYFTRLMIRSTQFLECPGFPGFPGLSWTAPDIGVIYLD